MSPVALPVSPPGSSANLLSPAYNTRNSYSNSDGSTYSRTRGAEIRDEVIHTVKKLHRRVMSIYKKLTPLQRILAIVGIVVMNVFFLLFLIFNERIFGFLEPYAVKWKHTTGGWTILWAITFLTAFPPMIGYSSCGTMAGFVYGIGEGWIILASATVAGSFCSFLVSRTILKKYVERMVASDKRFAALTLTLKEDGLKLLCMIRLCPLPYSLSNGAMSTFPTVEPSAYALATALVTPKLFIPVFIGSRLASIAKNKGEMPFGTKLLNWASIIFFGLLGLFVGWFIYQKTMQRARDMEDEEQQTVHDSARRSGRPPPEFANDPEAQLAADTLARDDDDNIAYFDDDDAPKSRGYRDDQAEDDDVFAKGDASDDEFQSSNPRGGR